MDIEKTISLYLDGELSSEAEAELHHTLAVSPEARALFRQHLSLHKAARDERTLVQPEPAMRSALFARLVDEEGMSPASTANPGGLGTDTAGSISPGLDGVGRAADTDRTPVSPESRREERRRKRRLIPILIPFVLIMIAGSALLYDSSIFFPDDPRRDATSAVGLNQSDDADRMPAGTESTNPTESGTSSDSAVGPDDETIAQSASPPEESTRSLGDSVMREAPSDRSRRASVEQGGVSAQHQQEFTVNGQSSVAPQRVRATVDLNQDGLLSSSDGFGASEAPDTEVSETVSPARSESVITMPNNERSVHPAPRSNVSYATTVPLNPDSDHSAEDNRFADSIGSIAYNATRTSSSAPLVRAYGLDTDVETPVTRDNWTEFLNELELQGISINPDGTVDMVGQMAYGGSGFGNNGIEYRNDSVYLRNSIGAADGRPSPETLVLSTLDYQQLGGQDGLQRARNGGGPFNGQGLDAHLDNANAPSEKNGRTASNQLMSANAHVNANAAADSIAPNSDQFDASPTVRSKANDDLAAMNGQQKDATSNGQPDASELTATSSSTTDDNPLEPIDGGTVPRVFVGVEASYGGTIDRSAATFGSQSLPKLNTSIQDRTEGRVTAGIVLSDASTVHRAFLILGASPYAKRSVESSYSRTVQSGDVVEQVSVVDPSTGGASSSFTIVRNQATATHSNGATERIEMSVEPWAGVGYRIDLNVGTRYSVGIEATGGVGTEFIHAGISLPIGFAAGRTIHIELKPHLRYTSQYSAPEQPTPGFSLGTSGSTELSGPDDDSRLSAGFGLGFVFFFD